MARWQPRLIVIKRVVPSRMPTASDSGTDSPLYPATPNPPAPAGHRGDVIAVSELNRRVRHMLEANLELLWVSGEISNTVKAASGHWYFSLKDAIAQVRCVMFRHRAAAIGFAPDNGMQVEVRALPSLYEPRGEFQLGVENMRRAGLGTLYEAFERLKARLQSEGLFSEDRKRALPAFPQAVGVVTSLKAAALRDVLTTLRRRAPMIEVIVYPTAVQGTQAAQEIAAAIDSARTRAGIDRIEALIICRGGGSIEDLWSFNEEIVARAMVRLQDTGIPVVSGVGHETDFTICDFVADSRAPTPTAAAELVSPDAIELRAKLSATRTKAVRTTRRLLDGAEQRLDRAARSLVSPVERLHRERDRMTVIAARIWNAIANQLESSRFRHAMLWRRLAAGAIDVGQLRRGLAQWQRRIAHAGAQTILTTRSQFDAARQALTLLDPARVLDRGYSIVELRGAVLRDAREAATGDRLRVRLACGTLEASVVTTAATEAGQ